jgi:microcystin-dependent protein
MPSALVSTGVQFPDNTIQRRAFPSGGILMWYGNLAFIPSGWVLCDGTSGTPDLRDRFVVGAGSSYAVGATGGANTVTLTVSEMAAHSHPVSSASTGPAGSHSHGVTINIVGSHTHPLTAAQTSGGLRYTSGPGRIGPASIGQGGSHSHPVPSSGSGGSHSHSITITTGSVGSGDSHENRPPFYALVYIMRV